MTSLLQLADRIEGLKPAHRLRFSVCMGTGHITSSDEETVRVLCEMFNHRAEIAASLRSLSHREDRLDSGEAA